MPFKLINKARIQRYFFRKGIMLEKAAVTPELHTFITRFKQNFRLCRMIRVGGEFDGGYLVPDILDEIKHCFSPGVGNSWDLEIELIERFDIECHLADASVHRPPVENSKLNFVSKFIGSTKAGSFLTLSEWLNSAEIESSSEIMLQMDIEGGEYDVLTYEPITELEKFSILIIEFHDFHKLFARDRLSSINSIFEKLYQKFAICHAHPNNAGGYTRIRGVEIPNLIEMTFIRHDKIESVKIDGDISLPHSLDTTNVCDLPDLRLSSIWWKGD